MFTNAKSVYINGKEVESIGNVPAPSVSLLNGSKVLTYRKKTTQQNIKVWNKKTGKWEYKKATVAAKMTKKANAPTSKGVVSKVVFKNPWNYDFDTQPLDDGYGHNYNYTVEGSDVTGYTKNLTTTNNVTTITYIKEQNTPTPPSDDDRRL